MCKKLCHIAQLIRFKPVNHGILLDEALLKIFLVYFVDHAESLPQKTVIPEVCSLLTAAFQEHNAQLHLNKSSRQL
jgi:hypothetical protein